MVFVRYVYIIYICVCVCTLKLFLLYKFSLLRKLNAQAENIKFTLEQQMLFFARLVGHFTVADEITPLKIDNFD